MLEKHGMYLMQAHNAVKSERRELYALMKKRENATAKRKTDGKSEGTLCLSEAPS